MKLSPPPTGRRGAPRHARAASVFALIFAPPSLVALVVALVVTLIIVVALVVAPAAHASALSSSAASRVGAQEVAPQAQEVGPAKQKGADARADVRAQSVIRGRVVYDDTNRPVRRAEVQVYDPNRTANRAPRTAWTNARGEFTVRSVAAGSYYVRVTAPGLVTEYSTGPAPTREEETTSAAVDGTNSVEVRVRVRRGGAVSGKVTYADGEPAASAIISLRRRKDGQLTEVNVSDGHGRGLTTDDRGHYRIAGIQPGEYVVGAAEQKMGVGEMDANGGQQIYQSQLSATFYPGALSPQQATAVSVEAGREVEDIDITLVERNTHSVSGTVVERGTLRPVVGAEVLLRGRDPSGAREPMPAPPATETDEQGRWWLEEVQEGGYVLHVAPQYDYQPRGGGDEAAAGAAARKKFVARRQELQVSGGDIAGLVVEVSAGARVSGRVAFEGGRPLPPDLEVHAEPTQRVGVPVAVYPAQVGPDGTFAVEALPAGDYHLTVRALRGAEFYTKSVTADDDADLLRAPLNVEDGAAVRGVRVLLSPEVATLTGRVLSAQGATLRGAFLMLVPAEPARRRLRIARLYASTSPDGSFRVSGAPGEYAVLVFSPGQLTQEPGEAAFEARFASASRVTLGPGESKRADFTVPGDK